MVPGWGIFGWVSVRVGAGITIVVVVLLIILIVDGPWPVRSSCDERGTRSGEHRGRWDRSDLRQRNRRLRQFAEHYARR